MLVARRKLLRNALALLDAATLGASFVGAYLIVGRLFGRDFVSPLFYLWVVGAGIAIWLVCLRCFGLYRSATYHARVRLIAHLLQSHFIASLILLSMMYLTKSSGVSRLLLQTFIALSFAALTVQKFALRAYLERVRRRANPGRRKILLVACPTEAFRYIRMIGWHASMSADVVGIVAPAAEALRDASASTPAVLGTLSDVPTLMQTRVIDEIVIAAAIESASLERLSRWCATRGVLVRILVDTPRPALGVWTAEYFGDGAFLLSLAAVPQNPVHLVAKRALDVCGGAIGMCACAAAYLWYGARLRHETDGSVLFRQRRVGHNGRRFTLYKFRTMHTRAEELKTGLTAYNEMRGPIFKLSHDPRVTATGRRLRRRHLDELPQFWNVLRGEMSLVGTRPPTEDEVAAYDEHHHRRLSMKPGLTGLWQLHGNGAVKDFEDVVKLDCEYIDNWSLWLDLKIMSRTVAKVIRGDAW
jgi:exopolysaccharide biosynthesis polyprenyl glycosylphosphotransferase